MSQETKRKRGRPPAGHGGDKVSAYPQLTIRLPVDTKRKLTTLSLLMATPMWRIIDDAVETYVRHLPPAEQKLLGSVAERIAKGDWPVTSHWQTLWTTGPSSKNPVTGAQVAKRPSAKR